MLLQILIFLLRLIRFLSSSSLPAPQTSSFRETMAQDRLRRVAAYPTTSRASGASHICHTSPRHWHRAAPVPAILIADTRLICDPGAHSDTYRLFTISSYFWTAPHDGHIALVDDIAGSFFFSVLSVLPDFAAPGILALDEVVRIIFGHSWHLLPMDRPCPSGRTCNSTHHLGSNLNNRFWARYDVFTVLP